MGCRDLGRQDRRCVEWLEAKMKWGAETWVDKITNVLNG